jgi:hypothetical protein
MAGEMFPDETDDDGFCMMASPSFGEVENSKLNIQNLTAASALHHPLSSRLRLCAGDQMLEQPECRWRKGEKGDES